MNIVSSHLLLILGILIASFVIFLQLRKKATLTTSIKSIFWFTVTLFFSYAGLLSYMQYQLFQEGPLSSTIGTINGLKYFLGYARFHFLNTHLVSFLVALLLFWIVRYLDKKRGEIHFEKDEIYIIALGIFMVGYPAFLAYVVLVLFSAAIASTFLVKKEERLPLYYFWMPACITILLFVQLWAVHQSWWASFLF